MEKHYFVVFRTNSMTKKGEELCKLLDTKENRQFLREFHTKRAAQEWVEEWQEGLLESFVLKPVS